MFSITLSNEDCKIKIASTKTGAPSGSVTGIKIKRRELGDTLWTAIFTKTIVSANDFDYTFYDKYTRSRRTYEYRVIPMTGSVEGVAVEASIECVFDGIIIADLTASYVTFLNASYSLGEHHNPVNKVETLGRKYPFIVRNGAADYLSGSVTGIFAPQTGNLLVSQDAWKESAVRQYKNEFIAFLKNGLCKTLKTYDGQMWYVSIDTNPKENITAYWWASEITFEWTEVGAPPERVVVV